ncbi:MAG: hypothetical protein ACI9BO_000047 [Zhongshania sp.]|jgi:hypothetical protein
MMASSKMILAMKILSLLIFDWTLIFTAVIPPHDCGLCVGVEAGKKVG